MLYKTLLCLFLYNISFSSEKTFINDEGFLIVNKIDKLVLNNLQANDIKPAMKCSDSVFIRRAFFDIIGKIPSANEVKAFLDSGDKEKRSKLIDKLLEHPSYADYWSMRFCDILRVKAEFPINLWPNGVQAYHRWIHTAMKNNMPYDKFASELLSSSGSNFRVPQVNFYRALQGQKAEEIAEVVALTFLGMRIENWSEKEVKDFSCFFSRISQKPTAEWKETIICFNPEPVKTKTITMIDGSKIILENEKDPRKEFVTWLIKKNNPYFARNAVNRIWYWLIGKGIINPVDNVTKHSEIINPALLNYLEKEFIKSKFNTKHILKLILNSRTYSASSITTEYHLSEKHFASYTARQLDAEIILDSLHDIFGDEKGRDRYKSEIPEPFSFIPERQRSVMLADASITNSFLTLFGRPSRDTGMLSERSNLSTREQRLYLINSTQIQTLISSKKNLKKIFGKRNQKNKDHNKILNEIYLTILSRYPTKEEKSIIKKSLQHKRSKKSKGSWNDRINESDLLWILINTKEFLYRH